MNLFSLKAAQTAERTDQGRLRLSVLTADRSQPIDDASVTISYSGDPDSVIEEANTDSSGQIPELTLPAPPLEYSMAPSEYQPYAEYTFRISKEGYEDLEISVRKSSLTLQLPSRLFSAPATPRETFQDIVIPAHTLFGNYPEKIPEDEIKPIDASGEIVLSRVVIPETIVVHDGTPDNTSAQNYFCPVIGTTSKM